MSWIHRDHAIQSLHCTDADRRDLSKVSQQLFPGLKELALLAQGSCSSRSWCLRRLEVSWSRSAALKLQTEWALQVPLHGCLRHAAGAAARPFEAPAVVRVTVQDRQPSWFCLRLCFFLSQPPTPISLPRNRSYGSCGTKDKIPGLKLLETHD